MINNLSSVNTLLKVIMLGTKRNYLYPLIHFTKFSWI